MNFTSPIGAEAQIIHAHNNTKDRIQTSYPNQFRNNNDKTLKNVLSGGFLET